MKLVLPVMPVMLVTCVVLVISYAWRAFSWIWWEPMKLQRKLREQGIRCPSYRLLIGNLKELAGGTKQARLKPMELSHRIVPRVLPFINEVTEKYGKMSAYWFGPSPWLQIMDPDLVKCVFSDKVGQFSKSRPTSVFRFLFTGLVSYNGDKWMKHRRIVNPAFHLQKLKMMLPAFHTSCYEMVNKWQQLVSEESKELDVWPELQNLTGDVISRTAFGSSYEEGRRIFQLQTEQADLVSQAAQYAIIPGFRFLPTKTNRRMKEVHKEVRTLLKDIINKRQSSMKIGASNSDDLLGLLMESNLKEIQDNENSKNAGMTIDDVIEECKLFYFAGQETTASLIAWAMIVLSMHPQWQVQAREEILQVFGKTKPDLDGLNQLKIVTMILYEVLRLYPPIVMIMRATHKEMKLGTLSLPPGVQVAIPTLLVHRDHDLWGDDAEEFNPARFSDGVSKATKNQVSFFPFGWGPRICIGQNFAIIETKMALAMILQQFSFELSPNYLHAPATVITLQPQHGAQLILHKL